MSFLTFPIWAVIAGVGGLAALLYYLQRLRVRHHEIEVPTTLFWHEATRHAQARVFRKRFRHPAAYMLILLIASLIWLALADPHIAGRDDVETVVLLDGSAGMARADRFDEAVLAMRDAVARLDPARRTVILCGGRSKTLLHPEEDDALLAHRLSGVRPVAAPSTLEQELRRLAVRRRADSASGRLQVLVFGGGPVRDEVKVLLPDRMTVLRVGRRREAGGNRSITALGVTEAGSGAWNKVDVLIEVRGRGAPGAGLSVTLDDAPLGRELASIEAGAGKAQYLLSDVPAAGGTLNVRLMGVDEVELDNEASLVLPDRPLIRVALDSEFESVLRPVLEADSAVIVVDDDADVYIGAGSSGLAALELVAADDQAEAILLLHEPDRDSASVLERALSGLAIDQIDAMTLADDAQREIIIGAAPLESADQPRRIRMWRSLLSSRFDLIQTRAFPLFVARAVRWLANQEPLAPYVAAGEPMKSAQVPLIDEQDRTIDLLGAPLIAARASWFRTNDGRIVCVPLLEARPGLPSAARSTGESARAADFGTQAPDPVTWLLLAALVLLVVEWDNR